jgi:hypothetical protein
LLKAAGTDASKQFDAFHNASVLQKVAAPYEIGQVGEALEELDEEDLEETEKGSNPLVVGEPFGDMVPFGDPMWYQDWYSPFYNDSHRTVRKFIRDFVEKEIMPFCHEWDEAKAIPKELFKKVAKAGILAAVVGHVEPEYLPYGLPAGIEVKDWDLFHSLIVTDELSRCGSGGVSLVL